MTDSDNITVLLKQWSGGDIQAGDALMPLVYDALQRLARRAAKRVEDAFDPALSEDIYRHLNGLPVDARGQQWH